MAQIKSQIRRRPKGNLVELDLRTPKGKVLPF